MKCLWAPWRMEYILAAKDEGCFLCDLLAAEDDEDGLLIARAAHVGICLNRYPYNNGHLLVFPRRHVSALSALEPAERHTMMDLVSETVERLRIAMSAEGFNVGINLGRVAGAGLEEHLHMHVVPRWNGDSNFMPVLGDLKVIPQHLLALRDQLRDVFADIGEVG